VSSTGPHVSRRKFSLNQKDAPSPPDARFEEPLLRPDRQLSDFPSSRGHLTRSVADDYHPYANPNLVTSHTPTQSPTPTELGISHNDSITRVPESIASASQRSPHPTRRSTTSVLQGKDISAPIHGLGDGLWTTVTSLSADITRSPLPSETVANGSMTARTGRDTMRSFTLISLEEARAQRSGGAITKATQSGLLDHSLTVPDARDGAEIETRRPESIVGPSRTRAHSMGAGAKAKTAMQSVIGAGSGPKSPGAPSISGGTSGKALKHKKSGLLRLFNSRAVDKEEKPPVPPIPTLSSEHITHPRVSRTAPHTPLSDLPPSPSVDDEPLYHTRLLDQKSSPNLKRLPHLYIDTEPRTRASRGSVSTTSDVSLGTRDESCDLSEVHKGPWPQSAPANASDFPRLKLRPVSTVFSAHFTDHMVFRESLSSTDTELDTPSSASMPKGFPPRTPSSVARSTFSNLNTRPPESIDELQEQIVAEWPEKLVHERERMELERRVRELEKELEGLRKSWKLDGYCGVCGRGQPSMNTADDHQRPQDILAGKETCHSTTHRLRARTVTSRFNSPVS